VLTKFYANRSLGCTQELMTVYCSKCVSIWLFHRKTYVCRVDVIHFGDTNIRRIKWRHLILPHPITRRTKRFRCLKQKSWLHFWLCNVS